MEQRVQEALDWLLKQRLIVAGHSESVMENIAGNTHNRINLTAEGVATFIALYAEEYNKKISK